MVSKPHHYLRFTSEDRDDIKALELFIEHFNGKSIFLHDEWLSSEKLHMYPDASGNLGYAAVYGSKWCLQPYLDIHVHYHISIKERFPIVLLVEIWGPLLCNQKCLFFSDNLPVVEIVNKQSSTDKT